MFLMVLRLALVLSLFVVVTPAPTANGTLRLRVSGANILVVTRGIRLDPEMMAGYVECSAKAVASYYGSFPVDSLTIRIKPATGKGVKYGNASGWNGASINLHIGIDSSEDDLADDWILIHELLHLGIPSLDERYSWLEEGIATYVEPILRARAGLISRDEVWQEWLANMPKGLGSARSGLNYARSWSSIYWGGALFCLLADIEYRQKYGSSLEEALRAVNAAGGNITEYWSIERMLATADQPSRSPVLKSLFRKMSDKPYEVNLQVLWKALGVELRAGRVIYDRTAPLARVRDQIVPSYDPKRY
ncbi:MAG: hypothetical protein RMM17_00030 [Acidobacteriota bacterium]|nr:hypothetical protein [Blastocatellia bacterium]MDW8411052.1 hypothetical protein [Acidobacteriota bacterium]